MVSERLPLASQSNSFQETNVATEVEDNRESEPTKEKETTESQEIQPKLHREETTIRLIEEASVDSNSDLSRSPEVSVYSILNSVINVSTQWFLSI